MLRKQNGFKDEITFVGPSGKDALAISLWDRKESADQYGRDTYPQVLKGLAKVVQGTPQVHGYEVSNSTFHKIARGLTRRQVAGGRHQSPPSPLGTV
jgi:hypothetical protein